MRKFFYIVWLVIWETIRYPFKASVIHLQPCEHDWQYSDLVFVKRCRKCGAKERFST
jgi:hypothetical protein